MKIVNEPKRSFGAVVAVGMLIICGGGFAAFPLFAEDLPVLPDIASMAEDTPADAPVASAARVAEPEVMAAAPVAAPAPEKKPKVTEAEVSRLLSQDMGSPLVNEQVAAVVKELQETGKEPTLEDMNKARALLARLEVMTNIVEKLAQLQQADKKRREAMLGGSGGALAGMLPANVLKMSAMEPVRASSLGGGEAAMPTVYTVSRISGLNGDMTAMIDIGKRTTMVRIGDTLPDGSVVKEISGQGVRVKRGGGDRMLRISAPMAVASDDKKP